MESLTHQQSAGNGFMHWFTLASLDDDPSLADAKATYVQAAETFWNLTGELATVTRAFVETNKPSLKVRLRGIELEKERAGVVRDEAFETYAAERLRVRREFKAFLDADPLLGATKGYPYGPNWVSWFGGNPDHCHRFWHERLRELKKAG